FSTCNQPEKGKARQVLSSAALMDGQRGSLPMEYFVRREVLDEARLDEVGQKQTWSTKPSLGERVKESLRCSGQRLKQALLSWVPVLHWLPRYSIRENAVGDLISGCSVGIMHLPQEPGMAYALLASLPPVFGLYTSLYPVLVYFIFGTSRHVSLGTFAVISIMIGSVTERMAPDSNFVVNGTNGTETLDSCCSGRVQSPDSVRPTPSLTGLFQILLGVLRFGFVVTYLSEPLVRGYTTGSACHVCISQLKYLFGISPARFTGPLSLIYTLVDLCKLLPETKVPEVIVSVLALAVLIVVKELNACYRKKLPLPIPIELIVVIAATIITHFCDLGTQYKISVVGEIPSGLKAPLAPDVSLFPQIIGDTIAVAIVGYAINISLGKTFALKYGYKVDSNQELVALGLSNTIGGLFQCYSVTSSLSRSLVQESTGGKTQLAGVVSSIIVLVTVLKLGPLFEDLPKAVLSTIVLVNLKGMFKQFMDVPMLLKSNKVDLLVWLVTFTCTILLNLDLGLAVAIGFSMLTVIFRTQLPTYSILGNVSGTDLYLDTDAYQTAREIPGIKIFRSSATIYYTNAEMYLEALQEKSGIDVGKLLTEKKKRDSKLKRKQKKEKRQAQKEAKRAKKEAEKEQSGTALHMTVKPGYRLSNGRENWAYQHDTADSDSDMGSHGDDAIPAHPPHADEEKGMTCGSGTHSIILDISTTNFVDMVTVKTLKNIFRDFGQVDLDVYLAGGQACVVEQLETANFFSDVPKSKMFVTVHDAVLHILHKMGRADYLFVSTFAM
uniref:Solute carrier family 26 member 6 n=2 Tax=Tetraodon nigroviridis TaxID=99883 RepID=H3CKV7_TETNG